MPHLSRLYAMASVLEKHEKKTKRGMSKDRSSMDMYKQFKNHQCGRFTHKEGSLYVLSKIFVEKVSKWFQISFPNALRTLDKNLLNEGLLGGERQFGGIHFTLFSIT
jgi:hypothetical protein